MIDPRDKAKEHRVICTGDDGVYVYTYRDTDSRIFVNLSDVVGYLPICMTWEDEDALQIARSVIRCYGWPIDEVDEQEIRYVPDA